MNKHSNTISALNNAAPYIQLYKDIILVHGGGPQLTEMIEKSGQESKFNNGRRVTDQNSINLAVMVLNGEVNTKLLAISVELGIPAIGISGIDGGMIMTTKRKKTKQR